MRKFLKPTLGEVFIPELNRNIDALGEEVEISGYIEKRLLSGALVYAEKILEIKNKKEGAK